MLMDYREESVVEEQKAKNRQILNKYHNLKISSTLI